MIRRWRIASRHAATVPQMMRMFTADLLTEPPNVVPENGDTFTSRVWPCGLRVRRLQALPPGPLVELALDAGYADQAHMTAEVTRLARISRVRFVKDRAPTAA